MTPAHLEVLLTSIALVAAFMALVVSVSEWWLTVPQKLEDPGDTALAWGQAALARWERRLLEEATEPSRFMLFLPCFESYYEVIHGEVIRFVERVESETTGGDQIRIEGIRSGREEALRFYGIREESGPMEVARGIAWGEAALRGLEGAHPELALGRSASYRSDIGASSACFDCPRFFRPQDLFIGQRTGVALCEPCLDRRVGGGRAKKPAEF